MKQTRTANHRAGVDAGFPLLFAFGHRRPGPPQRGHQTMYLPTRVIRFLIWVVLASAWGCRQTPDEFGEVHRDKHVLEQSHTSFWVYYTESTAAVKRPVVLVAAAGSGLFFGKSLAEDDVPEHLPYAEAGFVVIAYDVSGPLSRNPSDPEIVTASRLFKESDGGVRDGLAALAFAEKKYSFIDSNEVYVAGHSSAGTVALALAQKSPRVKGCVAYAPVCDPHSWVGKERLEALEVNIPGFEQFFTTYSPKYNIAALKCPVFIFHAEDDPGVLPADLDAYVSELEKTNKRVTHIKVKEGGHYNSMIDPGLAEGVSWFLKLRAKIAESEGPANGSQPIRPETNSTSSTIGSSR